MKLKVLPRASRDLVEIHAHISANDVHAALLVLARLKKSLALIADRPEIGRQGEDPRTKEWSVPGLPYVIPYRVRGDTVEVLRVFHTSRGRPPQWVG